MPEVFEIIIIISKRTIEGGWRKKISLHKSVWKKNENERSYLSFHDMTHNVVGVEDWGFRMRQKSVLFAYRYWNEREVFGWGPKANLWKCLSNEIRRFWDTSFYDLLKILKNFTINFLLSCLLLSVFFLYFSHLTSHLTYILIHKFIFMWITYNTSSIEKDTTDVEWRRNEKKFSSIKLTYSINIDGADVHCSWYLGGKTLSFFSSHSTFSSSVLHCFIFYLFYMDIWNEYEWW